MLIGIDASRAFLKRRTGIEEYAYQTIKHLRDVLPREHRVVLYVRKKLQVTGYKLQVVIPDIDFDLPKYWRVRGIWAPRFWTQIRLSLEMLFHPPDVLFVPAHTVPIIHPARNATRLKRWLFLIVQKSIHPLTRCDIEHSVAGGPKKTIVTVHGLEYEFCPEGYAWWERLYMRMSIRYSCRVAETVICVSENTKKDVADLYDVSPNRIKVIYEGCTFFDDVTGDQKPVTGGIRDPEEGSGQVTSHQLPVTVPYLLFIGRLEERKNVVRTIEAFEMLKEKYHIPHTLVLVGKPGYGYAKIKSKIENLKSKLPIVELGYVTEKEKRELLKNSDIFLFPTLYEGFGIPVLEAQAAGVPVVTSRISSLPEVAGEGAVYVDPASVKSIVLGIEKVLADKDMRDGIIAKGMENVRRFSWEQCASEIAKLLTK